MKTKKSLFELFEEEKKIEEQPQKQNKKILIYNFLMSFIYGFFKIAITVIVSIVGTVIITILFTALLQSRQPQEVLQEIIEKIPIIKGLMCYVTTNFQRF